MKKMNVLGQKTDSIRGKINRPNLLLHNVFFLMIILIIPEMNIIDFSSLIGEGGGLWQKWDFIRRSWVGGGVVSVLDVQSSSFLIKQNWICAVTTHHAEPNMNILLASNLPYESDVRQWSPPLVIPLHCLWVKSNNRTHWSIWMWRDLIFLFFLWFRSFTFMVRLLFHCLFTFSSFANKKGWLQNEY